MKKLCPSSATHQLVGSWFKSFLSLSFRLRFLLSNLVKVKGCCQVPSLSRWEDGNVNGSDDHLPHSVVLRNKWDYV